MARADHERASLANAIKYNHPPEAVAAARDRLAEAVAERAVDDPVALARAARIVRIALERGKLTLAGGGDA